MKALVHVHDLITTLTLGDIIPSLPKLSGFSDRALMTELLIILSGSLLSLQVKNYDDPLDYTDHILKCQLKYLTAGCDPLAKNRKYSFQINN